MGQIGSNGYDRRAQKGRYLRETAAHYQKVDLEPW